MLFSIILFCLLNVAGSITILVDILPVVLVDTLLMSQEYFGHRTLRLAVGDQVEDDLFQHENRDQQAADLNEFLVNKGCPAHPQIAIEETKGVILLY